MKKAVINSAFAALFLVSAVPIAYGQAPAPPQIYMVTLQVVTNADGTHSVITPKGDLADLPGAGPSGSVAQVYYGSQGGFWYTDRTGQTIDLTPSAQALATRRAAAQQATQVPQYAPEPQYSSTSSSYSGSSVGSAMGTAAAAGMGAMAGAAMTNYYRAPYGAPMYYGHDGGYYWDNGERRKLEDLDQNQKKAVYVKRQNDQNQKQAVMQQASQNRQASAQQDFQKQQQWYNQQRQQNPDRFQSASASAGSNPFVNERSGGRGERSAGSGGRGGRAAGGHSGGGRGRGGGGGRRR
jgi:uncharacterized membrane protein YgcG